MTAQEDRRKQIEEQLNAHRQDSLRRYRENRDVVRGVLVLATNDSCDSCKALAASGVHPLSDPPALPNPDCNSVKGWCRCSYSAVTR